MRTETVEEYLKRGGKVIRLEKELNTINGAYKTYDATMSVSKRTVNAHTFRLPEIK
tara:strand:+ start:401 stop:568 length:168 start_codon:yes stop_codon:yes gene_type:complete